jgi:hypothetical protein
MNHFFSELGKLCDCCYWGIWVFVTSWGLIVGLGVAKELNWI